MKVVAYSQIGEGKKECQDKILVGDSILSEGYYENSIDRLPAVIAVADGVGGNYGGEMAAFKAVEGIRAFNRFSLLEKGDIESTLDKINREIVEYGDEHLEYENMATTLTGIYFKVDGQILFHVGNTRAYLISGEYLTRCTKDHTAVQEAIDSRQLINDIKSNIITACMGDGDELAMQKQLVVENTEVFLESGNVLMLTSDGIHDYLNDEEISYLYSMIRRNQTSGKNSVRELIELAAATGYTPEIHDDIQRLCAYDWKKEFIMNLVEHARENGSQDDISVVLIYA